VWHWLRMLLRLVRWWYHDSFGRVSYGLQERFTTVSSVSPLRTTVDPVSVLFHTRRTTVTVGITAAWASYGSFVDPLQLLRILRSFS
jgi:hypothetical protein